MEKNVTPPRPSKKNVKVEIAPEVQAPVAPPAAEVITGTVYSMTADAPAAAPVTQPTVQPAPVSTAAAVLADEKQLSKPVTVPVALTAAQTAARAMNLGLHFSTFYAQRPQAGSATFTEPTKADLAKMRADYVIAYNTANPEAQLDPADIDDLITIGSAVKAQVDTARKAFAATASNQGKIDTEWLQAGIAEAQLVISTAKTMIAAIKGVSTPSTPAAPGEKKHRESSGRAGINWAGHAPKLLSWANTNGLAGVFFIDKAKNGYKDIPHAVKLLSNGRFEICSYNPSAGGIPQGTGEIVDSPLYYNSDGNAISTHGGSVPNIGGPMRAFVALTVDSAGKIVTTAENATKGKTTTVLGFAELDHLFAVLGLSN